MGKILCRGVLATASTALALQCVAFAAQPEPPNHTIVCHDAFAGGYAAFPDVCRLKDGRLMCVFYASYHHIGLPKPEWPQGGRIVSCVSSDEGYSWSKPTVIHDGPDDDRDPSIAQLKNGRLICNFFTLSRTADRNLPLADPYSEPFTSQFCGMVTSDDGGKTWSEPSPLAPKSYFVSSPIRELQSGRLIVGLYREGDGASKGAVTYSDDLGKTWCKPIDLDNRGAALDAETDVMELAPNRVVAVMRGSHAPMHWCVSDDGGTTWGPAQATDFIAHCPYLHRTADGAIVLGYRQYDSPTAEVKRPEWTGTALRISRDQCATWGAPVQVDPSIGAYPSMVDLKDGSTLVVYYEEGANSKIRARRFRVADAEVQFLPMVSQ
jgi:hypothetical protein